MINKKIIGAVLVLIILLLVPSVNAYRRLCLGYGDSVPSDENPIYTCWHDLCQVCVNDNNYPTLPSRCNGIEGCETLGDTSLDTEPPEIIVNSPINDFVYNSRKVLFDIESNEPFSLYYLDNINGRGRWKRLGSNLERYYRSISFKDGLNDITIKAKDRNQNSVEIQKQFYVDSKKPKIRRTNPRRGFADGNFEVQFKEENPKSLILYYGNSKTGQKDQILDIEEDCDLIKKKYYCEVNVDLDSYDGEEIGYYFVLEDIAGNIAESKSYSLDVDITDPVINNPESFWTQGEGRYAKYIYFNIDITEENFDEVGYSYWDGRKVREKRLCSRLKDGICEKRKSFKRGHYDLTINVLDEAGNSIGVPISFDIDY